MLYLVVMVLSYFGAAVSTISVMFFLKYQGESLPHSIGWMFFSILMLLFFIIVILKMQKNNS